LNPVGLAARSVICLIECSRHLSLPVSVAVYDDFKSGNERRQKVPKRNRPVNRGDFIVKPQAVFLSLAVERGNRKVSG